MGGIEYNASTRAYTGMVANHQRFDELERMTNGDYNRGELVLRDGSFAAVNNHVHLTFLNNKVTTRQENLNVRTAVNDLLQYQFTRLNDSVGKAALECVKERLLGTDNKMLPISRDEVRTMINMLKAVQKSSYSSSGMQMPMTEEEQQNSYKAVARFAESVLETSRRLKQDAAGIATYRQQDSRRALDVDGDNFGVGCFIKNSASKMVNTNTINVDGYRVYEEERKAFSELLGSDAKPKPLDYEKASELMRLAFSRARLFNEDDTFNKLAAGFQEIVVQGESDPMAETLCKAMHESAYAKIECYSDDKIAKLAHDYGQKQKCEISQNLMRKVLINAIDERISSFKEKLLDMDGVRVEGGRIVDMENFLDRKSTILKQMLVRFDDSQQWLDDVAAQLTFDREAAEAQQWQKAVDELDVAILGTVPEQKGQRQKIVEELNVWIEGMAKLPAERMEGKVDEINAQLEAAGVKSGKNVAVITTGMLTEMTSPERLLEFKQRYVRALGELGALGFSAELVAGHLSKELLLGADDYDVTLRHTLRKLLADANDGGATEERIRGALKEKLQDREEILQMMNVCTTCKKRIEHDTRLNQLDEDSFKEMYKPLVDAMRLGTKEVSRRKVKSAAQRIKEEATSVRKGVSNSIALRLVDELPRFVDMLTQRAVSLNTQINLLSDVLGADTTSSDYKPVIVQEKLDARLEDALRRYSTTGVDPFA